MADLSPLDEEVLDYIAESPSAVDESALSYFLDAITSPLAPEALIEYPLDPIESVVVEEVLNFIMSQVRLLYLGDVSSPPSNGTPKAFSESADDAMIARIRSTIGTRRLWDDAAGTDVQIGRQAGGSLTTGLFAVNDLNLAARGSGAIPLNEVGAVSLAGFIATSIIGAINEARAGSQTVQNDYTNGEGTTLEQGEVVYQSSTARNVLRAIAAANNTTARVLGFVVAAAGIGAGANGRIASEGRAYVRLVGGLTVANGEEVYLSAATAGRCTNAAPSTAGQVAQTVGFITDVLLYNGTSNLLVEVQLVRGPKVVI